MNEYLDLVCQMLDKRGVKTKVRKISKNNGTEKVGLEYLSGNEQIHPVVYLDGYYEDWKESGNLHVQEIEECLKRNIDSLNMDTLEFENWWKVKDRIIFRLVNGEKNKELLSNIPHIKLGELAVIFTYLLDSPMVATVTITNALANFWHKNSSTLYSVAEENSPKLFPYEISPISNFLNAILGTEDDIIPEIIPMHILSNQSHTYGASTIP